MASMTHYNFGASMSLRKTLDSKLSAVQPGDIANARHLSNLAVTNHVHSPIPKSTFPKLSLATKRQLNVAVKNKDDQWKLWCSDDAPGFSSDFIADDIGILIHKFFYAFNSRDEQLLEDVLSCGCIFEDLIFQIPFDGEQSVKQFLRKVRKAMGPNMSFKIDSVQCNDDRQAASALGHLEWDNEEIPFTRGCIVFECEEVDENLLIRKITGGTEPGELGDFLLKLLEAASTVFDNFPDQTRKLLSKSNK